MYCVGAGISTLMSIFSRTGFVLFPPKSGEDAAYERRNGWKCVYFPLESASFVFVVTMINVLFPSCTSIWRVNNYNCRQGESKTRRNENTINIIQYCTVQQFLCTFKID